MNRPIQTSMGDDQPSKIVRNWKIGGDGLTTTQETQLKKIQARRHTLDMYITRATSMLDSFYPPEDEFNEKVQEYHKITHKAMVLLHGEEGARKIEAADDSFEGEFD